MRITGTKNIAKITKSMKMVSAAKLRGDQQRLIAAQPFAVSLFFVPSCYLSI
jgi:F-type H+-transporting ATPase subunit gamma